MAGKWHLGHFTENFLPTARGFDSFFGYLNGETYYWSKRNPDYPEFIDIVDSDTECYDYYNESDVHTYSTTLYTNRALEIIDEHPVDEPLFLYLAYQAVHDPFSDLGNKYSDGIPDHYLPDDVLSQINSTVFGGLRQAYMKSLYMLDDAVGQVVDKLEETGLMNNTYIIVMSDNGGCYLGGGKNGPLRGTKASLFEGGVKVDSFIYSPLLSDYANTSYSGLMHVSDWFPTIMSLANIEYDPDSDHAFDGVSQVSGWTGEDTPRTTMLYNYYTAIEDYDFNIWTNGSFAVRNSKYKLLHTYNDTKYGAWYSPDDILEDDDSLGNYGGCAQQFLSGDFTVSVLY